MIRLISCLFLVFLPVSASLAQPVFRIDSLPPQGLLLDKGWRWHAGDNPDWAKPDVDDGEWEAINPDLDIYRLPQIRKAQIGWFRLRFQGDSMRMNQPLTLVLSQVGAFEIYLNGHLLHRYGTVSANSTVEQTRYLRNYPISLMLINQSVQVLAVRYSCSANNLYVKLFNDNPCFRAVLLQSEKFTIGPVADQSLITTQQGLLIGFFLLLGAFSLFLYFLFKTERFYLFLGLYCLGQFAQICCQFRVTAADSTTVASISFICSLFFSVLSVLAFLEGLYTLFQQPKRWPFYGIVGYAALTVPCLILFYEWGGIFSLCFYLVLNLDTLRLSFQAARRRRPGAWILFLTIVLFYVLFAAYVILSMLDQARASYLVSFISLFVAPFGVALFLAGEFARTHYRLATKLAEVETLSAEKQQILTAQNETLERQVTERTTELNQSLSDLKSTQTQLIQREKMASLGELTAGIAHEIQNPLNFVNNFSEVSTELLDEQKQALAKGDMEEAGLIADDLKQNLQKITHHGGRASAIVKGMLEHSRTSTGERQPTNLNALTDEYLRLAYQGIRGKDKTFECQLITDFDPALGQVEVAPQEIGRVLLNLYNNAFYALQQKQKTASPDYQSTLTVSTARGKDTVEIHIKDNGMGIPELVKAKIFQPFFTTKPTGEGTGLGLSLSYDIVTKGHGGTLSVESIEGQGTTFCIILPTS